MIGRVKNWWIVCLVLSLFLSHSSPLIGEEAALSLHKKTDSKIALFTVPKAGTHLMIKLLYMILGKRCTIIPLHFPFFCINETEGFQRKFNRLLDNSFRDGRFVHSHFEYDAFFENYMQFPLQFKVLVLIRDPRDVLVSFAYWDSKQIENELGRSASIDEKLMLVINGGYKKAGLQYPETFDRALAWMEKPGSLVLRFEDLCGSKGGRSREDQQQAIQALCEGLEVSVNEEELSFLADRLWGKPSNLPTTFRKGKSGKWRDYFTPEHTAAFKERFGEVLIKLGYEEDYDW